MKNSKRSLVEQPDPIELDPLSALLRRSARALIARALIAQAVEAELMLKACHLTQSAV